MNNRIVIIGAGIIGASVAYHLSKRSNREVVVLERKVPGSETTTKSVSQFGFYGDSTQYQMKSYAMELYNKFFNDPRSHPRYVTSGLLEFSTTKEEAKIQKQAVNSGGDPSAGKLAGTNIQNDCVSYLPKHKLKETILIPPFELNEVVGGVYRPRVGYLDRPHELAHEFLERAREHGAEVAVNSPVTEVILDDDDVSVIGIETSEDSITADEVICAAGPWNVKLAKSVGIDLPVYHTIAPAIQLQPSQNIDYTLPVLAHRESGYSIHRRRTDEVLVSYNPPDAPKQSLDPENISDSVPEDIKEGMIDTIERFLPSFLDFDLVDEWIGIRSQTPDGNPVVGRTKVTGFNVAATHTSGIQLAPYIGEMISTQIIEDDPGDLYNELSITRFDGYSD